MALHGAIVFFTSLYRKEVKTYGNLVRNNWNTYGISAANHYRNISDSV